MAKLVQVAQALPLAVGAALLASAEGYTPRANGAARPRARGARRDPGDRERARRQPARAQGARRASRGAGASGRRSRSRPARVGRRHDDRYAESNGGEPATTPAPTGDGAARQAEAPPTPAQARCGEIRRPADGPGRRNHPRKPRPATVSAVLVLLAIGFVAGNRHRALPVRAARATDRAGGRRDRPAAARDHRRDRRQLHRLHALRGVAARPARAARRTCSGTSRSRLLLLVAATLLCADDRRAARAAAPGALAPSAPATSAAASCSASASGSCSCPCAGPVLAAVTVIAAKREVGFDGVILLTLAYALGAAVPMLAIALPARRASRSLRGHAVSVRRGAGVLVADRRARDRATASTGSPDGSARLHRVAAGALRALGSRAARARGAHRRALAGSDRVGRRGHRELARGLRPGAGVRRDRRLAQLAAADACRPARPGRADRLLDVLVHQLPAHAAVHHASGTRATARPD